jgi:acyl-CoA synthetase (AMP-forming)/AMP-acid ligase II
MSEVVERYRQAREQLTGTGAPFELSDITLGGVQYRSYKDAPRNLRELFAAGRAHGDAVFLYYQGEEWRFDDYFAKVDALAAALVAQFNIKPGDRIAIAMRNYPEWMLAYTAIALTGAVVVPLNSWWQSEELQYALNDCGATLVFCDAQRAQALDGHINAGIIVARSGDENCPGTDMESLYQHAADASLETLTLAPEDPAMIMYTSGTTGKPKGALSTQAAVCQTVMNFECSAMYSAMANPHYIEYMMGAGVTPVALLAVPLFHVSGCYPIFMMNLRAGRKVVVLYKWDAGEALRMVREQGVTILSGAPSMLQDVFRHPDFATTDTTHLSGVGAGGSAMSPTQVDDLFDSLDNPFPGAGYGMTETNGTGTTINGDALKERPRSAGQATPVVDIKICDSEGKEVPQGERGEVWIKSPTNASKYWNKPEAREDTFVDGWVLSGDVGYLDADGFLFIVDRIKDMVIRGGENIYCVEIEAVLEELDDVLEGAAFGVEHDSLGEELAIMLRLKQDSTLDAEGIRAHFSSRVAAYKVPAHVHVHDEPLPRNATGKVLKKELASILQGVAR